MSEERAKFLSKEVTLMSCIPGNLDHDRGESATIITIASEEGIEPLVITLDDTRRLAVRLLSSLFAAGDEFAEEVLSDKFPVNHDGRYHWPDDGTERPIR